MTAQRAKGPQTFTRRGNGMQISIRQVHAGVGAAVVAAVALIAFNPRPGVTAIVAAAPALVAHADHQGVDARLAGLVAVNDAAIAAGIQRKFGADTGLDASNIRVLMQSGHAALRGTAVDAESRARAERLAGSVTGVLAVTNQLALVN